MISPSFKFHKTTPNDFSKIIDSMKINKKTSGDIPTYMLKSYIKYFRVSLAKCIIKAFLMGYFLPLLKMADVVPCFKKSDPTDKSNYRPISILRALSKVFYLIIFEQIQAFIEPRLNMCGFRRGYGTRHTLFILLKKWQKSLHKGNIIRSMLMDLSKAYNLIPHDLLIVKLEAYGFSHESLKLLLSYLSDCKQRVKLGSSFSEWLGVSFEGSILGPIFLNKFINDLFLFIKNSEICNFADDNTFYVCDNNLESVV
ncbi:uncharacterized protein LOC136080182 [Hydra vulgaris]|uniref:Uncharacterized protein LOC136080182 n=1 Tax=Hydra vulgaris TaxID=6087 RepID=A0ABM4BUL1_HYDVU